MSIASSKCKKEETKEENVVKEETVDYNAYNFMVKRGDNEGCMNNSSPHNRTGNPGNELKEPEEDTNRRYPPRGDLDSDDDEGESMPWSEEREPPSIHIDWPTPEEDDEDDELLSALGRSCTKTPQTRWSPNGTSMTISPSQRRQIGKSPDPSPSPNASALSPPTSIRNSHQQQVNSLPSNKPVRTSQTAFPSSSSPVLHQNDIESDGMLWECHESITSNLSRYTNTRIPKKRTPPQSQLITSTSFNNANLGRTNTHFIKTHKPEGKSTRQRRRSSIDKTIDKYKEQHCINRSKSGEDDIFSEPTAITVVYKQNMLPSISTTLLDSPYKQMLTHVADISMSTTSAFLQHLREASTDPNLEPKHQQPTHDDFLNLFLRFSTLDENNHISQMALAASAFMNCENTSMSSDTSGRENEAIFKPNEQYPPQEAHALCITNDIYLIILMFIYRISCLFSTRRIVTANAVEFTTLRVMLHTLVESTLEGFTFGGNRITPNWINMSKTARDFMHRVTADVLFRFSQNRENIRSFANQDPNPPPSKYNIGSLQQSPTPSRAANDLATLAVIGNLASYNTREHFRGFGVISAPDSRYSPSNHTINSILSMKPLSRNLLREDCFWPPYPVQERNETSQTTRNGSSTQTQEASAKPPSKGSEDTIEYNWNA